MNSTYKLSDEAIAALVKMLQLAMLTGTDISDWYRMIQLSPNDEMQLVLDVQYATVLANQIGTLERQAQEMLSGMSEPDDSN